MIRVQKIPHYIPNDTIISTEDVEIASTYSDIFTDTFLQCGNTIEINDTITKYVITTQTNNVIKDHVLIGVGDGNLRNLLLSSLYVKEHVLNSPNPESNIILFKRGLESGLRQLATPDPYNTYRKPFWRANFLSQYYLDMIMHSFDILDTVTNSQELLTINNVYKSLDYFNNECRPDIQFNIEEYIEYISLDHVRYPADPSRHIDLFVSKLIEQFSPHIHYDVRYDWLSMESINNGVVRKSDLFYRLNADLSKSDNLASQDRTILEILNKSQEVVVANSSYLGRKDPINIDLYSLYETFQQLPFTEVYLKCILFSSNQYNRYDSYLIQNLKLSNYYTNYFSVEVNPLNEKFINMIINDLLALRQSADYELAYEVSDEVLVEVIIQDFHALVVIHTDNRQYRVTFLFDLILMSLVTKTLYLTE